MKEFQNIDDDISRGIRLAEFQAQDTEQEIDARKSTNKGFTQVYDKGWNRLNYLLETKKTGAARLYMFLAKNVDSICGAVVVSQDLLAEELKLHRRTVIRLCKDLEDCGALVIIKMSGGVNAYALDPTEIWKSWDEKKENAAFVTRTLVKKQDKKNSSVKRKLSVMMKQRTLERDSCSTQSKSKKEYDCNSEYQSTIDFDLMERHLSDEERCGA